MSFSVIVLLTILKSYHHSGILQLVRRHCPACIHEVRAPDSWSPRSDSVLGSHELTSGHVTGGQFASSAENKQEVNKVFHISTTVIP